MNYNPEDDGKTHYNIYSKGKTELGRLLSNFAQFQFRCNDGQFQSIEGYWHWLNTKDDRLKKMFGWQAKALGKELGSQIDYREFEEFKKKILSAIDKKLKALKTQLKQSNLPFTHYYVYDDKAIDAGYGWIVEHIEAYRQKLKKA